MRIVQIGSYPMDVTCIKGGVEASLYGLAMEQARNHQVSVIDIPRTELKQDLVEQQNDIAVFRFSAGGTRNLSAILRLKSIFKIIRLQNPDICHVHTTGLFALLIYVLLKIGNIPVSVTVHGLAHIEKKQAWTKNRNLKTGLKYFTQSITEFIFISLCPVLIVDTQYVAEAIRMYRKQCKIVRMPRCVVIPQGINPVFLQLDNKPVTMHILAVGALNKRKGYLELIESMVKVKTVFPDIALTIAGSLSDLGYFQAMQKSVIDKGLKENIEICPDLPFEEVLNLYQQAEVFVLHSEEESQGIVFCEAMAAGKPIVATNVGGVSWVVENKVNGLLCDFGDTDTFANHIIRLLEDENLRKKMETANKAEACRYDWKKISDEILALYKKEIK